jgi:hypothetical protein
MKTILENLLKFGAYEPQSQAEKLICQKIAKKINCFISENDSRISIQLGDIKSVERLLNEAN